MHILTHVDPLLHTSFIDFTRHDDTEILRFTDAWKTQYGFKQQHLLDRQKEEEASSKQSDRSPFHSLSLSKCRLCGIAIGSLLACFTVGLDDSIISTALTTIANEFKSLNQIGWYGSAYFLPQAVLQPFFGKMYTIYKVKTIYLLALTLFEVGSVISFVAPNSEALIVGRAISGIGGAGISAGGFNILISCFPETMQPIMVGLVTVVLAISNCLGPILGGILTDAFSWRWCFGINVPIGCAIFIMMCICLKVNESTKVGLTKSWGEKIIHLDFIGTTLLATSLTCLLFGLQSLSTVVINRTETICVFTAAVGAAILVTVQQKRRTAEGLIPMRIIGKRNVWASAGLMFSLFVALANHVYFLPVFLQTVMGVSASASGIRTLPYLLSLCCAALFTVLAQRTMRLLNPLFIGGSAILCIASGLITTLTVRASTAEVVLYQVLAGSGIGLCMLCIVVCPRTVLCEQDIPRAQSTILMFQILGQTLCTQITTVVFFRSLSQQLATLGLSIDDKNVLLSNPKALRQVVNVSNLAKVLKTYSSSFHVSFVVAIVAAGAAFCFACCVEWRDGTGTKGSESEDQ